MYYLEQHILSKKGYRMVPRKTQVLDIEISEVFFDGSQSLVFRVILSSQSLEFSLPTGLEVQDLQFFSFCLVLRSRIIQSSWVQLIKLNVQQKIQIVNQDKAVYWWASTSFHWHFLVIFLVVVVPFVSFRFQDVDDYENKILSLLSSARA